AELVAPHSPHRAKIHFGKFDDSFQPGKRYSLILMLDVLEHMQDPVAALRRAEALLQPDGLLLLTVPAFRLIWTNHDVLNEHRTRFTKSALRKLVDKAGFKILDTRYFFVWLFPVKLCVRGIEAIVGSKPVVPRIPIAWLNHLLCSFSRAE